LSETGPKTSGGPCDFHSHLVPGVDDGARTLEDSLESVRRFHEAGVRRIITTPHIDGSLTRNESGFRGVMEQMDAAWSEVSSAVARDFPDIDFRRGHEVMVDHPDTDFSDVRLRLGGGPFLLIEWPRLQIPPGTAEVISRIVFSGFKPIIAHPERYHGLDRELRVVGEWRRRGARLQINHGSLVGRYGQEARTTAFRLLKRGWADYMSSDFHGRSHLKLYLDEAREALRNADGEEQWTLLSEVNPSRIFRNEEPLPVAPLPLDEGFRGRLRKLFQMARG
jgi:protein-tyrosine phosphatase